MANDHTHYPENMRRHSELAPRRPADGQQRAALRREGDGTPRRVPGSDPPQSSHVLYGTSGVLSSAAYALHQSLLQLKSVLSCLQAKRPPEDTRWRSSRGTTSSAAKRTGGHRRVATRKTTGDLATQRGASDPERRAEWTTVLR